MGAVGDRRGGARLSQAEDRRLSFVVSMCLAEVLGMAGFATFPALQPSLAAAWSLSHAQGGWINGIYFAGYVLAVPFLVSRTDRADPRPIYLGSAVLAGLASLGFAFLAEGFWSALLFRALAGAGLAGTYMPGLKILSDHVDRTRLPRALAFYTSSFSVGAAASFFLSGAAARVWGWRGAFGGAAALSAAAILLVLSAVPSSGAPAAPPGPGARPLLDFRPVLANRAAMGYVLGYAGHMWELFGQRSWIVAFLAFHGSLHPGEQPLLLPTTVASLMNLAGVPASIFGNELAARRGRERVVRTLMLTSALVSAGIGFCAPFPSALVIALCLVSGGLCFSDSAALSAGAVLAADPRSRGATLALHSCLGFVAGFLGSVLFGVVLDFSGGTAAGWGVAFASLALGTAAVAVSGRLPKSPS